MWSEKHHVKQAIKACNEPGLAKILSECVVQEITVGGITSSQSVNEFI